MLGSVHCPGSEKRKGVKNRFWKELIDYLESFRPNERIGVLEDLKAKADNFRGDLGKIRRKTASSIPDRCSFIYKRAFLLYRQR